MKNTTCIHCGKLTSQPGSKACPACPAITERPMRRASDTTAPELEKRSSRPMITVFCVTALVTFLVAIVFRIVLPNESAKHRNDVKNALQLCQQTVTSATQFGQINIPPKTMNYGSDGEYYFAWPDGSFESTNKDGKRIQMSASCLGSLSTGSITTLIVNGKRFQ